MKLSLSAFSPIKLWIFGRSDNGNENPWNLREI